MIDYIPTYRRKVIDSLIAFQIENFVTSEQDRKLLNGVVNMQLSVEELFLQVFREDEYDKVYQEAWKEGKKK